jgi:hypothetical protein
VEDEEEDEEELLVCDDELGVPLHPNARSATAATTNILVNTFIWLVLLMLSCLLGVRIAR